MSLAQQKRLYEAERCLWGHGREFASNLEVTEYLDSVTKSDWFVKKYGWVPPIRVAPFRSTKWAGCADRQGYVIYLNRRTENVVLHELAHLLCASDQHDEMFVGILTHLVRNAMGFYAWSEFTYELKRVDFYGV